MARSCSDLRQDPGSQTPGDAERIRNLPETETAVKGVILTGIGVGRSLGGEIMSP